MDWHRYFSPVARPVQACLIGSGGFGHSFLVQCMRTRLVRCRVAVDLDARIAVEAMVASGVARQDIRICRSLDEARKAWDEGLWIAAHALDDVAGLPLDILVEATGDPEAGARHATLAIDAGWHVALVSKEVDSVVGPALARKARQAGRVVTPVDGDQPSLLIGLISWARMLGMEIVAAGKASEYDFVYREESGSIASNGRRIEVPGFEQAWVMPPGKSREIVARRAGLCAQLPQRTVPDFCEMQIVANWTGLAPDVPAFHAPILRVAEVPEALRPRPEGGLLGEEGVLEFFHCLRRPDELSFAGGVFVVVRCADKKSWDILAEKGHVVSADRKTALIYSPRHLLGLEAVVSVIEAAGLNAASTGELPGTALDLVGRTRMDLPAGAVLAMGGHHHEIGCLTPELMPAQSLSDASPLPFYLLANRRLRRPVAAGTLVRGADVEIDPGSHLLALRRFQDSMGRLDAVPWPGAALATGGSVAGFGRGRT